MAWDPTDYKDMLDDDWNDRHEEIKNYLVSLIKGGNHKVANKVVANILGNDKVIKDKTFSDIIETGFYMEDIKEIAQYLMDKFYLTPMGRKRARMKNENKLPITAKLVKESFNEDTWKESESQLEPWGKNMKLMDELLDEFEEQHGSLEETSWEEIQLIKKALWLGYNSGKGAESSWKSIPPIRNQEGNDVSDWRDYEMGQ